MKLLKVFFVVILVIALIVNIAATPSKEEEDDEEVRVEVVVQDTTVDSFDYSLSESQEPPSSSSLRGMGRFLTQKNHRRQMTCNKFPRICRAKGSPGPHCCKKKCVNVLTDRLNCGMCGKKCKYTEICCGGKCVNPSFNKKHCGGCNNRCNKRGFCVLGLCNYA